MSVTRIHQRNKLKRASESRLSKVELDWSVQGEKRMDRLVESGYLLSVKKVKDGKRVVYLRYREVPAGSMED